MFLVKREKKAFLTRHTDKKQNKKHQITLQIITKQIVGLHFYSLQYLNIFCFVDCGKQIMFKTFKVSLVSHSLWIFDSPPPLLMLNYYTNINLESFAFGIFSFDTVRFALFYGVSFLKPNSRWRHIHEGTFTKRQSVAQYVREATFSPSVVWLNSGWIDLFFKGK